MDDEVRVLNITWEGNPEPPSFFPSFGYWPAIKHQSTGPSNYHETSASSTHEISAPNSRLGPLLSILGTGLLLLSILSRKCTVILICNILQPFWTSIIGTLQHRPRYGHNKQQRSSIKMISYQTRNNSTNELRLPRIRCWATSRWWDAGKLTHTSSVKGICVFCW